MSDAMKEARDWLSHEFGSGTHDDDDRVTSLAALLTETRTKALSEKEAENARLRGLLNDCADDLEEWVKADYASRMHYPSEMLKMARDMDNVHRARASLKAEGGEI